jgi:hypothetical protein
MSYIFVISTIGVIISNVILWHQFRDKNFLFLSILGIPSLIAFSLHILGKTYFGITPLFSFFLALGFFGATGWYTWRKFKDKTSMILLLSTVFCAIAVAYTIMFR